MSSCVCKILLKSEQICGCCCKMLRGSLFWDTVSVLLFYYILSVLWRCWLGSRKGIWPVKKRVVGCWRGYLSGAQIGFTFLVPAHPGSPGQRAVKNLNGCVCVPSVLWCCWLGGRKGIHWVVRCWRGYLSGARCRLAYGPADATATHCLLLL